MDDVDEMSGRGFLRRAWVLVVLGVAIAAVAVIGVLVAGQDRTPPSAARTGQSSHTSPNSSAAIEAQEVAKALEVGVGDPSGLVASGSKRRVDDPAAALPEGTTFTAHPDTWKPDGVGGGLMQVTVARPGQPEVDYMAVMVQEAGAWKVLATLATVNAP